MHHGIGRSRIEGRADDLPVDASEPDFAARDLLRPQTLIVPLQRQRDHRVHAATARERLHAQLGEAPALAEPRNENVGRHLSALMQVEQSGLPFEKAMGSSEADACKLGGEHARARREAGAHPFCERAVGNELRRSAELHEGKAERMRHARSVECEDLAGRRGRGERAERGGRVPTLAQAVVAGEPQSAEQLDAAGDSGEKLFPRDAADGFRRRERRRQHHAECVDAGRVVLVVEIERVRRRAVDEGRGGGAQACSAEQGGRDAVLFPSGQRRSDLRQRRRPRRPADDAEGVEHESAYGLEHGRRQVVPADRREPFRDETADAVGRLGCAG